MEDTKLNALHEQRVKAVKEGLKTMQRVHDLCNHFVSEGYPELAKVYRTCLIDYLYFTQNPSEADFLKKMCESVDYVTGKRNR